MTVRSRASLSWSQRWARHLATTALSVATPCIAAGQTYLRDAAAESKPAQVGLRFAAPLGKIVGVRELSDGRVLVIDRHEGLLLLSADKPTAQKLGRQGDGPGEYRSPARLFAVGGDTTVMLDGTNRKWYLLDAVRFVPLGDAQRAVYLRTDPDIQGMARDGSVIRVSPFGRTHRIPRVPISGRPELADSVVFLRIRANGPPDSLAFGHGRFLGATEKRVVLNGASENFVAILNPFQSHDQAVMFVDGAIAVARLNPYRVDWRIPGAPWIRGMPVADPPLKATDVIMRAAAAEYKRDEEGRPVFAPSDFPPWPELVPPFALRSVFPGSDGKVYVCRTVVSTESGQQIDVFERSGPRTGTIRIPPGSRFVGAGARGLYIAQPTDDGEEQLIRVRSTS